MHYYKFRDVVSISRFSFTSGGKIGLSSLKKRLLIAESAFIEAEEVRRVPGVGRRCLGLCLIFVFPRKPPALSCSLQAFAPGAARPAGLSQPALLQPRASARHSATHPPPPLSSEGKEKKENWSFQYKRKTIFTGEEGCLTAILKTLGASRLEEGGVRGFDETWVRDLPSSGRRLNLGCAGALRGSAGPGTPSGWAAGERRFTPCRPAHVRQRRKGWEPPSQVATQDSFTLMLAPYFHPHSKVEVPHCRVKSCAWRGAEVGGSARHPALHNGACRPK